MARGIFKVVGTGKKIVKKLAMLLKKSKRNMADYRNREEGRGGRCVGSSLSPSIIRKPL